MILNAPIRKAIGEEAMKALFKKQSTLLEREHALFEDCYCAALPLATRKAVHAVPDGWLKHTATSAFNVGGQTVSLRSERAVPVPHGHYG